MLTLLLFEHSSCQRPFAKLHTVKLRKGLITALLCTMWPTWVMQGHRQQLSHLRGRSITMATFPCSTAVSTLQQVMLPGDLAVREVHGESSEGLTALAEAAGRVLLRQEDLVPEPVRHLDTRREVTETRGNGNEMVV